MHCFDGEQCGQMDIAMQADDGAQCDPNIALQCMQMLTWTCGSRILTSLGIALAASFA